MKRLTAYALLLMMLGPVMVKAQEIRCKVTVNADKIQYTNKRLFKTLETSISEFVNSRTWTKDNFAPDERIECAMLITVDEFGAPDQFTASIQINANRPVFNSGYASPLFNYKDQDFSFTYQENSPIEFTPDQFRSNLSSVLAYYIYVILGNDYDTFSLEGGTPYYSEAQRIVSNAQSSSFAGWNGNEKAKNRFVLIDNIQQQAFLPLRTCMYNYHRLGLDEMYEKPVEARKNILLALQELEKVHALKPLSFNVQLFFLAKVDELVNIFSKADQAEKDKLLSIVKKLDPININKYNNILKPN
ncbi:MAG: DUF4835 family protein [Bacteroidota bacterium]